MKSILKRFVKSVPGQPNPTCFDTYNKYPFCYLQYLIMKNNNWQSLHKACARSTHTCTLDGPTSNVHLMSHH